MCAAMYNLILSCCLVCIVWGELPEIKLPCSSVYNPVCELRKVRSQRFIWTIHQYLCLFICTDRRATSINTQIQNHIEAILETFTNIGVVRFKSKRGENKMRFGKFKLMFMFVNIDLCWKDWIKESVIAVKRNRKKYVCGKKLVCVWLAPILAWCLGKYLTNQLSFGVGNDWLFTSHPCLVWEWSC